MSQLEQPLLAQLLFVVFVLVFCSAWRGLTAPSAQTVSDSRGLGDHSHPEAAWGALEAERGDLGCPADCVRGIPSIQLGQTGQAAHPQGTTIPAMNCSAQMPLVA